MCIMCIYIYTHIDAYMILQRRSRRPPPLERRGAASCFLLQDVRRRQCPTPGRPTGWPVVKQGGWAC